jgi:hypothetical protein
MGRPGRSAATARTTPAHSGPSAIPDLNTFKIPVADADPDAVRELAGVAVGAADRIAPAGVVDDGGVQ